MQIDIELTEQEEKALKCICQDVAGVKWDDFLEYMAISRKEAGNIIHSLHKKGFNFNGTPSIRLSSDYVHYDSLIKHSR